MGGGRRHETELNESGNSTCICYVPVAADISSVQPPAHDEGDKYAV
jgi:hypothetical protein